MEVTESCYPVCPSPAHFHMNLFMNKGIGKHALIFIEAFISINLIPCYHPVRGKYFYLYLQMGKLRSNVTQLVSSRRSYKTRAR